MNVKGPGSRLLRWRFQLAEYYYVITYRRGSQNTNTDVLSRIDSVTKKHYRTDEFDEDRKKEILIIKASEMHYFSTLFGKELYMVWRVVEYRRVCCELLSKRKQLAVTWKITA